jgi:hypothetical protein
MLMESSTRLMTDAATRAPASLVADSEETLSTCPLHGAQFDATTGRKQSEPRLGGNIPDMDKLPQSFLKRIEHSAKIIAEIKTSETTKFQSTETASNSKWNKED